MQKKKLPTSILLSYSALILATAIWGGALPVIKITLDFIPPFTFLLLRFLLVGIVMLPIAYVEMKINPIHYKDIKNFLKALDKVINDMSIVIN